MICINVVWCNIIIVVSLNRRTNGKVGIGIRNGVSVYKAS